MRSIDIVHYSASVFIHVMNPIYFLLTRKYEHSYMHS